ncbi:MAG: thiamine-phosphate kinase [Candidatus Binatia bacterium]
MRTSRTIADVGEFGFLSQLLPRLPGGTGTIVGPGQDCAVIRNGTRRWLFTVDALVEGVHFEPGWMSPHQFGRKSFAVNASDIAAMGGRPRFCVVSLGLRRSYLVRDLSALQAGIVAAASECGASVVGGNLARSEKVFVSIALLGEAPKRIVTRQGARPGDWIYATGTFGDAALGVRLLRRGGTRRRAAYPVRRFREPSPRLQAGRLLVSANIVSAMIDVSDGLIQDLGHICRESQVRAEIQTDQIPLSAAYRAALGPDRSLALHGGEDYELLCTVPERNVKRLQGLQARLGCSITCIGRIARGHGVHLTGTGGTRSEAGGYDHFRLR